MEQLRYDVILATGRKEHLLGLSVREWLEQEGLRVLLCSFPLNESEWEPTLAQVQNEGMLALLLHGGDNTPMDLEAVARPLIARARTEWRPFLYGVVLGKEMEGPPVNNDLPVNWLQWGGSFRHLAHTVVAELIGRGWKRPPGTAKKRNPDSLPPKGGNQTIRGNRNIQIGGDLHGGADIHLNT